MHQVVDELFALVLGHLVPVAAALAAQAAQLRFGERTPLGTLLRAGCQGKERGALPVRRSLLHQFQDLIVGQFQHRHVRTSVTHSNATNPAPGSRGTR